MYITYIKGELNMKKSKEQKSGKDKYITEVVIGIYEKQIILLKANHKEHSILRK